MRYLAIVSIAECWGRPVAEGRTDPQRRWTLVNEGEHDFAHLSYDGPPIKVGERVVVVPADDRLTAEDAQELLDVVAEAYPNPRKYQSERDAIAKLGRIAGREAGFEVVPADDRLTTEELNRLSYAVGVPVGAKDAELFAKLRRLAGREDDE